MTSSKICQLEGGQRSVKSVKAGVISARAGWEEMAVRGWTSEESEENTHKGPNSCQKLRLHGLFFGESASDQDRVVRDLVRNLMCKARQSRGCTNEWRGVKGRGHPVKSQKMRQGKLRK